MVKNIYNQKLKPCKKANMFAGSWYNNGYCNEIGGGYHQICINNISKNLPKFSHITGQSNWSLNRKHNNHCVCLGAWALYNNKEKKKQFNPLDCDAIPKTIFTEDYLNIWNKWNNIEEEEQIIDGIDSILYYCNKNDFKSKELVKNYCSFTKKYSPYKNSKMREKLCK